MRTAILIALTVCPALVTLPVASGDGVQCMQTLVEDVGSCFQTVGLELTMSGQQDATKLLKETQAMDLDLQCANLNMYQSAISCSMNHLKQCLDTLSMGGSIPDSQKFSDGMEVLCKKREEFDNECFKKHYPDILMCGEEKVKEVVQQHSDSMTIDDIICLSADVNYDCSKMHLDDCPEGTLSLYLEQLNTYQVPAACVNRPPGRADRESYIEDDKDAASTVFLGSVVVVASLAMHLIMIFKN